AGSPLDNPPQPAPANPPVLVPAQPLAIPPVPAVNETLRYWVFGVEMPRVMINEVFAEYNYQAPLTMTPPPIPVHVWTELFCPMPAAPAAGTVPTYDTTDNTPVQLVVPPTPTTTQTNIAPYRVMLANTQAAAGGPLLPRP